jgi:hypothetical protein
MTTQGRTLFIETPDANWILENTAFQDFFYEHCSIYTPASMSKILGQYGLLAKTTAVYGGQYMWTEASLSTDKSKLKPDNPHGNTAQDIAEIYVDESARMLADWSTYIQKHSENGPVAIWGAASKGVTFTLLMSQIQDAQLGIACAIDLNEAKQKCFMPITSTPIVSPEDAKKLGVATVIIMNPNYLEEIKSMAATMDWSPEFAILND